jgi:hypothetical protein
MAHRSSPAFLLIGHSTYLYVNREGSYGFVQVTNPRYFNVTGGLPLNVETNLPMPEKFRESGKENNTEVYVISMFHQLHYLVSLKRIYWKRKYLWSESYAVTRSHCSSPDWSVSSVIRVLYRQEGFRLIVSVIVIYLGLVVRVLRMVTLANETDL